MVFPWIPFLQDEGDMGDLEFIQQKVVDGDYFQVSGDIDAVNDTIEYVPASGKTAFLIEAKITMKTNPSLSMPGSTASATANDQVVAELKIDSTTKSKAKIGSFGTARNVASGTSIGGGAGVSIFGESKFNVLGISLVGDAAKKIEIENIADGGGAFATMSGYVIDT